MKSQELRIGNYVFSKETQKHQMIVGVTLENPFIDAITFDYTTYNEIEPIPLTEQWLIDFGLSGRLGEVSDTYHIGINPVTHDWLFDIVWIHGTDYPFYRNGQFMIKHVHQIQNLYFAITGQELQL